MLTDSLSSAPDGTIVTFDARPEAFAMDTTRTAILVVDMQNDFGAPGGMFHRAGIDISSIRSAVAPTARVLATARSCALPIIYLKMAFKPDLSDAGHPDSPSFIRHRRLAVGDATQAPDGSPSRILIRDTWNTDILAELAPTREDTVLYKHRFSGFFETGLDEALKRRAITTLIVTGCTTSICVDATVRDAMYRDYHCVLLEDCMGEPIGNDLPRSNHVATLLTVQVLFGWVSSSGEFVSALDRQRSGAGHSAAAPSVGAAHST